MANYLLYGFVLVVGALNAVQSGANAQLAKSLDRPFAAAIIIAAVVFAALLAAGVVMSGLGSLGRLRFGSVPWWAWCGGLIGAAIILSQLFVARQIGAAPYLGLLVTAGVLASIMLDHFGLAGFEVHRAGLARLAGAALMVAGVALVAVF